ncbi:protein Skeletor, isoforms B/C [Achroia grisella]|uniref:protein Skeletor, isoforms B/C n=1 Tax=Achroia grisella TaxID=688607 RepID=UPI0027D2F751|nr:protein Skeletor, isoforms B/C [Achroia grisella]
MRLYVIRTCLILVTITAQCRTQEDEDGPYLGKYIGKLNTYHHQVSGDVYAVDDWTILLVKFNYDGTGEDTFFWAGDSGRPGPQGFIIPDEHGKTNILERYHDTEIRLPLPEGKRLSRTKWFAVYDIASQNAFGDVYVPDDFEPPAPRSLAALSGSGTPAVSSQPVQVLDSITILIPELKYDGNGEDVYFWTGNGAQPSANGQIVPDEYGYLEPLRTYRGEDVRLRLPGDLTVSRIDWLALWDRSQRRALASVLIPRALNVPPAASRILDYRSTLPNCKQLHRDYQVSWEVFGNQITIELAAQMEEDDYMAFGISGNSSRTAMLGADVAVAQYSRKLQAGLVADYNVTAVAPCVQVLGAWRGVCRDTLLGALDSNQVFGAVRADGLTRVTYRRTLKPEDSTDLEWVTNGPAYVVWAVGALDSSREPSFHRLYPRGDVALHLVPVPAPTNDCVPFTVGSPEGGAAWEVAELFDPALRVFQFRLGPSGGRRGLAGRAGRRAAPALAFYVNGQLAPDLQLRRGLQYTFKVYGGNDPHSADEYHPLIVTAEATGGLERLSAEAQRATRVLAGVHYPRRGRLAPAAAGGLCIGRRPPATDARRDDDYATFRAFNRSLQWDCSGSPAELHIAPNSSWPDLVYYNSFTHAGMGGRIFIVDRHRRNIGRRNNAIVFVPSSLFVLAALGLLLWQQ